MLISPSASASCDAQRTLHPFLNIIPKALDVKQKLCPKHFTRTRKLPLSKVITCTLSLVGNGTDNGVDIHVGNVFRNARRSGLWPSAEAVHRSALSKARQKVPWEVFQESLHDAVGVAYGLWPDDPQYTWHGRSVFAIDGSKYTLPATEALRNEFDPTSGLEHAGKGHYPQCLVSTLYDVFRRLPVARTIASIHRSEREEAAALLPRVPDKSVLLFDRGYPSYDLFRLLTNTYRQAFVFRCPASATFPAVEAFVKSGKPAATIWITPSNKALAKLSPRQRKRLKAIRVRVLLLHHPDGTVSVLITNLLNRRRYPREDVITLYFRRWHVEDYYRDEKVTLQIETFHSRTPNGIRQELFAAMIMTVIARTMMLLAANECLDEHQRCQFKNAILTLAAEAALLVPEDPEQALVIFKELLQEIARVKYYPPATPRPAQPRINKHPLNKWSKRNRQTAT
jgi:hypothetical protein